MVGGGVVLFRGDLHSKTFCAGGNPSEENKSSGDFLDRITPFARLHESLESVSSPMIVVCHGATRGGGMLFPLFGSVVVSHADATFGFPEIRRGVLPGVVSVAALRRLSRTTCSWLMCTGDTIDASAAQRLGLVDTVGTAEHAAELAKAFSMRALLLLEDPSLSLLSVPPDHYTAPSSELLDTASPVQTVDIECDAGKQVVRLQVDDLASALGALQLVDTEMSSSLRAVILSVAGQGSNAKNAPAACKAPRWDVLASLADRGVTLICSVRGHATSDMLLLAASAHYRVFDSGASFGCVLEDAQAQEMLYRTLHAEDVAQVVTGGVLDATKAFELGFASEIDSNGAEAHAVQFASWLTKQPMIGLQHNLQLTNRCFQSSDSSSRSTCLLWRLRLLADQERVARALPVKSKLTAPSVPVRDAAAATAVRRSLRTETVQPNFQRLNTQGLRESFLRQAEGHAQAPGIHAMQVYVPRSCATATDLENAHHVKGKYSVGLMMKEFAACDEDEDAISMALTATYRLVEEHGVRFEDVGMLQVGTETLLDRSKSMKTHLMELFERSGNLDVEGIDHINACYGGTSALLACTTWVGCAAWDGRWAITVTSDVSDGTRAYPFLNGAAAVAVGHCIPTPVGLISTISCSLLLHCHFSMSLPTPVGLISTVSGSLLSP
jgi:enoyl-CoA hydratase/carnithine racemase